MHQNVKEKDTKANVVGWSGCRDNQTSSDAFINHDFAGAMTATLFEIMRDPKQDKSYQAIYMKLLQLLKARGYEQRAQLSSGTPIDLTATFDLF